MESGNQETALLLLAHGADPFAAASPHLAAGDGAQNTVDILSKRKQLPRLPQNVFAEIGGYFTRALPTNLQKTPFELACEQRCLEAADYICAHHGDKMTPERRSLRERAASAPIQISPKKESLGNTIFQSLRHIQKEPSEIEKFKKARDRFPRTGMEILFGRVCRTA